MTGHMKFYDEPSAWGVIVGEDGQLYVVRGTHVLGPRPGAGDRVTFEPRKTAGGLRAIGVRGAAGAIPQRGESSR